MNGGKMSMDLERVAGAVAPVDVEAVEAELARYLAGEDVEKPWRIETVGQADWAMMHVADARDKARDYDDQIELWEEAKARMMRASEWLEDRLAEWAVQNRTERIKSQQLAHGTVRTARHKAKPTVVDEDAVIEWAERICPRAVKVTKRFLISEIDAEWRIGEVAVGFRAIHKATGEVEEVPTAHPTAEWSDQWSRVKARLGEDWSVSVITEAAVLDVHNEIVPGVTITPERVTATVTPLGV